MFTISLLFLGLGLSYAGENCKEVESALDQLFDIYGDAVEAEQIGEDPQDYLDQLQELKKQESCYKRYVDTYKVQEKIRKFEAYAAKSFNDSHGLSREQCKDWRSPKADRVSWVQNQTALCYAFVLSDLISHQTGKDVFPWAIAVAAEKSLGQEERKGRSFFSSLGHDPILALKGVQSSKEGLCLTSNFNLGSTPEEVEKNSLQLNFLFQDMANRGAEDKTVILEELKKAKHLFKNLNENDFYSISTASPGEARVDTFLLKACKDRDGAVAQKIHSIVPVFYDEINPEKIVEGIDASIDRKNPIAVKTSSKFRYLGVGERAKFQLANSQNSINNHSVVVLGRRFNSKKNRCEYLIKDSASPGCRHVAKSLECESGTGFTWVPRTMVANTAYGLYRVLPRSQGKSDIPSYIPVESAD